jgi:hypothetical protein
MNNVVAYVSQNRELVTAVATVAAAIASLCSFLVAAITVFMLRSQSRGAVRPIPFISFGDYVNQILVSIQNRGVGPLVIKSISVVDRKTGREGKNVIDFMPALPAGFFWEDFIQVDIEGRPIAANDELVMAKFSMPEVLNPALPEIRTQIRDALSSLTMTLVVSDVYKSKYRCSREFAWFKRSSGSDPA